MMLQGKLVVLRASEPDDLPNYVRWLQDRDVLTYFGPYRPMNLAQEESWFERQNSDSSSINFAIAHQGQHVGGCGYLNINHQHRHAEVGIFIGEKSLWDQGLGRDALATIVDYGFQYLNFHRIYLRVFAENKRAIHSYEKVGFQHEGRWRQAEWRHGRWHDMLWMSVLEHERREMTDNA